VVDRYIEKSLELVGVQVNCQNPIGSGGGNEIGDQFCRNGYSSLVFSVLASITEVGNNRRDAPGTGPSQAVQKDEELDQMLTNGLTRGLHDKAIPAAYVIFHPDDFFAVRKRADLGAPEGNSKVLTHIASQCRIAAAGKYL
jgi:hypothetical protein